MAGQYLKPDLRAFLLAHRKKFEPLTLIVTDKKTISKLVITSHQIKQQKQQETLNDKPDAPTSYIEDIEW